MIDSLSHSFNGLLNIEILILVMLNICTGTTLLPKFILLACGIHVLVVGIALPYGVGYRKQGGFLSDGSVKSQLIWIYSLSRRKRITFVYSSTRIT